MIRHDVVQGSHAWIQARLGVVTGSGFDAILTPKTMKPSEKSHGYLALLLAETVLGAPVDETSSEWMQRGTELEMEARAKYGWIKGVDPEIVGFLTRDDGRVGCSPDSLVGDDGGLEIKCPKANTHTGYFLRPETLVEAYNGQVQAGLYITGRKWWDLMSYCPPMPEVIQRVTPNQAYLDAIGPAIDAFLVRLDAALELMRPCIEARNNNPLLT